MRLVIAARIREKMVDKHGGVSDEEIRQCFANLTKPPMIDGRAEHLTNPVTRWFVSETDYGRKLKICYMPYQNGDYVIKTAYEASPDEIAMFNR